MPSQTIHHSWDLTPKQAITIQQQLRERVITSDCLATVRHVAGIDVGFERKGEITRAAVAVLDFPGLALVETAISRQATRFPYVPGLLSFRELPAVLEAFEQLQQWPDLILCDGQGIAHPRRFGIACHLGLWLDTPSIGVAKSRLCGQHGTVPEPRGAWTSLTDKGERIGALLRTRANVKPVYISSGHRVSLETAVHYVMACTTRYRLPETTRCAHRLASG